MSWEQPESRHGRTAVFLLVAAILVATALAIALVAGAASQSSGSSDDVRVLGARVTGDTVKASGGTQSNITAPATGPQPRLRVDTATSSSRDIEARLPAP